MGRNERAMWMVRNERAMWMGRNESAMWIMGRNENVQCGWVGMQVCNVDG